MNPRQLIRRWHRDRAKVALSDRHFHDLRASCASLLHARGVPIRTIQRILRHAQLATTADIYTHIFDDALAEAASAMDGVFSTQSDRGVSERLR